MWQAVGETRFCAIVDLLPLCAALCWKKTPKRPKVVKYSAFVPVTLGLPRRITDVQSTTQAYSIQPSSKLSPSPITRPYQQSMKLRRYVSWWLGRRPYQAADAGPSVRWADRGFDSRPLHCRATTLGKLFTPVCLCSPGSII